MFKVAGVEYRLEYRDDEQYLVSLDTTDNEIGREPMAEGWAQVRELASWLAYAAVEVDKAAA
jgi:hypothetical protein